MTVPFKVTGLTPTPIEVRTVYGYQAKGSWDPEAHVVTLADELDPGDRLITLIHETLHIAEDTLKASGAIKRRMPHDFIEGAAFAVAHMLVSAGAVTLTREQWDATIAKLRAEMANGSE